MLVGQHSMSVTDAVRHGSNQVIYEGYPEFGYNYRLTDLHAAIGVSNCNGFPHSSRGGGSLQRNMVRAPSRHRRTGNACRALLDSQQLAKKLLCETPLLVRPAGPSAPGREGRGPLPYCDTEAMREHLAEISRSVDDGAHAVLLLIRPDGM